MCRNDEQIAGRIQQCKAVVVTDPGGFTVELSMGKTGNLTQPKK